MTGSTSGPSSAARPWSRSARRAAATTRAPAAANRRAVAAPKPLLAPVTKTVPGLALFMVTALQPDKKR
jgi:hypothetical protein